MKASSLARANSLRHLLRQVALCGLYLLAVTALFIVVRWPAYSANLRDEEGHFANILINQPPGPNYLLAGRFYGKEVYQPPQHPAPNYELLRLTGWLTERVVDLHQFSEYRTTILVRAIFSTYQLLFWWLMALAVFVGSSYWSLPSRLAILAAIPLLSAAPLAIRSSALLQIDSTAGIFCIGTFCSVLLLRVIRGPASPLMNVLVFLSGMLIGLGRNEWSVALLIALGIVAALRFALRHRWERTGSNVLADDTKILVLLLLGCLAGNLLSYCIDAQNWRDGWMLVAHRLKGRSLFAGNGLRKWLGATSERATDLAIIIALLLFSFWQILSRRKTVQLAQVVVFTVAACLLAVFISSTVSGETFYMNRYFVPSFIASSASAIALFPRAVTGRQAVAFAVAIVVLLAYDMLYHPAFRAFHTPRVSVRPGCLQILTSDVAYNRKNVDFIFFWIPAKKQALLAAKYGEPLCTP